jgi:hypothetical protein
MTLPTLLCALRLYLRRLLLELLEDAERVRLDVFLADVERAVSNRRRPDFFVVAI